MSARVGRRKPSNPVGAGITGALIGGASGALIGYSFAGSDGTLIGAILGALYFGLVEAITDVRRKPAGLKPLWHRLIGAVIGTVFALWVLPSLTTNEVERSRNGASSASRGTTSCSSPSAPCASTRAFPS